MRAPLSLVLLSTALSAAAPLRGLQHGAPGAAAGVGGAPADLTLTEQLLQERQRQQKGVHVSMKLIHSEEKFEHSHTCKGCSGLSGPCITGEWMKASTAMNHPHGMLFCSFYATDGPRKGKCAPHYHDCFHKHWKQWRKPHQDHSKGRVVHHAIRSFTPPKSKSRRHAASVKALMKQIALLKLEKKIAALKKKKHGGR